MEKLNRDTRRYLREINAELPCGRKMKRKVLEEIRKILGEFLSENPGADYAVIVSRFGTPQQIAATYVGEADTGELVKKLRVRRKLFKIVFATIAVLASMWIAAMIHIVVSDAHRAEGYYEVEIIEDQWLAEVEGG